MAELLELRELITTPAGKDLQNKVAVAVTISAQSMLAGTPSSEQINWVASVLDRPEVEGRKAYIALIAKFNNATVAAITGADRATILAEVELIVPYLVTAFNA